MRPGWRIGVTGGLVWGLIWFGNTTAGEIRGKVEVRSRSIPDDNPGMAYGHGGAFETPEPKPVFAEAQSVIVYAQGRDTVHASPPSAHPQMIQRSKTFIPPVLPVLVGTTVEFPNEDKIYHNVFSLGRTKKFDLGRYPTGSSKSVTFDRPGLVKVYCEIHKDMIAYILVLETPYFTVPDAKGGFALPDVPSGAYRIHIWHPSLPPQAQDIFVPKTGALDLHLVL